MIHMKTDVAVIGGGVMGCSALYHLAREGLNATLLERNKLTSGTSWHSAALVRGLRPSKNLTELVRYSQRLYAQLEQETGQSTGWIGKGSIAIATTPERVAHLRRLENLSHIFGIPAEFITAEQVREKLPFAHTDDILGAVWSPQDGRVGVSDLCAALTKSARAKGAQILEDTAVQGLVIRGDKIAGVETTRGMIECKKVVVCAGLWSRDFLRPRGTHLPLWACEHFYLLTKPFAGLRGNVPTLLDFDSCLYCRDDSGGLLVGSFEPGGKPIDPQSLGADFAFQLLPEDWAHFEPMMENALRRIPSLESAEVKMLLNGPESFTVDGRFMLGETAKTRGLFVGCGMNSIGVASSGGAGYALAHWVARGRPPFALPEVDPNRFPDCFDSAAALSARAPEMLGHMYEIPFPGWQPQTARGLRHTPLYEFWRRHDAHFGQRYGFELPLYFGKTAEPTLTFDRPSWFAQVGAEVARAHDGAAMFELSQLGKIAVRGADAAALVNRVCANNMARAEGAVIYTTMLNEGGTIESDLTAHRLHGGGYMLYVEADAIRRDMAWLRRRQRAGEAVALRDESDEWAVIGLFGAGTAAVARAVGAEALLDLKFFRHMDCVIGGRAVRAARLSFVGEAGWEITCAAADAMAVAAALAGAGAAPAGAFALASMRIEKRFLAYGHDMDIDLTPIESGLGFSVDFGAAFVGRAALQKTGAVRQMFVSVVLDNAEATIWGDEPVCVGGEIIGRTTSAAHGYRVGKPVAIALVDYGKTPADDAFAVTVRVGDKSERGVASRRPAYDPAGKRMRANLS